MLKNSSNYTTKLTIFTITVFLIIIEMLNIGSNNNIVITTNTNIRIPLIYQQDDRTFFLLLC